MFEGQVSGAFVLNAENFWENTRKYFVWIDKCKDATGRWTEQNRTATNLNRNQQNNEQYVQSEDSTLKLNEGGQIMILLGGPF